MSDGSIPGARDERFYIGVDPARNGGGWRQCKYCDGYADALKGEIPPVKHVKPCPVDELEALVRSSLSQPQQEKDENDLTRVGGQR